MIRIKIEELQKHRNECTFRPYLLAREMFLEAGIDLNYSGDSCDFKWIGQASYSDKSVSLSESIEKGLSYLDKIEGDVWLFDGQDSASLIGTYDVFSQSSAQYLLKNTLYEDINDYNLPWLNGRSYWGLGGVDGYKIPSGSDLKNVVLSGTNWLSTISPNWFVYDRAEKEIDVFAIFSYPAKTNFEFNVKTSLAYDEHRSRCIEYLKMLPRNIKVAMLEDGVKIPLEEYYNIMTRSKIVVAPFGYGEIAPRDIESAMVGSVLIKPDMSHISTFPNPYKPGVSFVKCNWNFSDLNEKITTILQDWPSSRAYYVENMRKEYIEQYNPENLVAHIYTLIKNSTGVEIA